MSHGFDVSVDMPYCLARHEDWHNNIIDSGTVAYVTREMERNKDERAPFPLHKFVHHGLSSQAMLFNLVGPMLAAKDLRPLKAAVLRSAIPWPNSSERTELEFEDREVFNEKQVQPTSIDLVVGDPAKPSALFIECKLVETGFGSCSVFTNGDCDGSNPTTDFGSCYLHHIGRTYLVALEEAGILSEALGRDTTCPLANHYQFYRELLLAYRKGGYFILLGDDRSPVFVSNGAGRQRGLWTHLVSGLPERLKQRVAFVSVQSVIQEASVAGGLPWVSEFVSKYGLGAAPLASQ